MTTDPFRSLRLDPEAVDPDPDFRNRLRAELERALDRGETMTTTFMPARLHTITPYLCCRDAHAAIDWYRDALGAELVGEIVPMSDTDDRVGHAELRIGDSTFFLADEWPEGDVYSPATTGHGTTAFVVYVPDVDAAFDHAVGLGATALRPVADQFHGDRAGWLRDPFGHRWSLATALPRGDLEVDPELPR